MTAGLVGTTTVDERVARLLNAAPPLTSAQIDALVTTVATARRALNREPAPRQRAA